MKKLTVEVKDVTNHHYTSRQYCDEPLPDEDVAMLETNIHYGMSTGNGALRVKVDGAVTLFAYRNLIYVKLHIWDEET